ncbi:MAG: hypothetical protein U0165_03720 [Polyangiaceae bacterium]
MPREAWIAIAVSAATHLPWFMMKVAPSTKPFRPPVEVSLVTPPSPAPIEPPHLDAPVPDEPAPTPHETPHPSAPSRTQAKISSSVSKVAPAPAQAGKTLTAEGTDAPADFTMLQGEGTYAGGVTARDGTSTTSVQGAVERGASSPNAGAAAASSAPSAPAIDRSRGASPQGSSFSCSHLFPAGFDVPDEAAVRVVVRVRGDGSAERVTILQDPGHGFAAAAISCAMSQRYQPALDSSGAATSSSTPPFVIRFRR